jgi:two-component system chemotaxis sensor kinase CheA
MEYDASLLREFAVEAQEHLESVEDNLLRLALQKENPDRELIDKVFRSVHSIKGGAGFLSLKQVAKLSHAMESLLSEFRSGGKAIGGDSIDTLIAGVDLIQLMLEDTDHSNDVDISSVHHRLRNLLDEKESDPLPPTAYDVCPNPSTQPFAQEEFEIDPEILKNLPPTHEFLYLLRYNLTASREQNNRSPVRIVRDLLSTGVIADSRLESCSENLSEQIPKEPLIYTVLYSTILDPDFIGLAVGLPDERVLAIDKEKFLKHSVSVSEPAPVIDLETPLSPETPVGPEITEHFVSEAEELLERVEHCLMSVSEKPENIAEAFRLIHSFKGNSGLLGLKDFERLSHQAETVLDRLRDRTVSWDDTVQHRLLQSIDALREALPELSKTGISRIVKCDDLIAQLTRMETFSDNGEISPPISPDLSPITSSVTLPKQHHDIRVDLEKLDLLINLVGELVTAEAMVSKNPDLKGLDLDNFERSAHNLRRIISDLQDVAMSMRMVPLSRTFRKMTRLAHDLSLKSGKPVKLMLIGEETEVDKTVIEHITDPLVHILRNCVDHGIESPDMRRRHGKPETGVITIRAGHEGGEVVIHVSDDGQGLNREKILKKALAMGIVSGDGNHLSDEAVHRLIFEPGFSTAEQVTDVSGRGVGMDVVRRNLEKIKGRIDVHTLPGRGTTLSFRIPLTLAIIEGMLIRVGTARYTIPLLSIREAFRPKPEQITTTMDGQEIVRIRNDLLPILRLHDLYMVASDQTEIDHGILIHVASGIKSVCLFADEIVGHHHTVIKGIPEYIDSARGISGFTILDNGEVSLILDVGSIIEMAER